MLNRTTFSGRVYLAPASENGASLGGLGDSSGLMAAADAFKTELDDEYGVEQSEQSASDDRHDTDDIDSESDYDDGESEQDFDEESESDDEESEADEDESDSSEDEDPDDEGDDSNAQTHRVRINGEDHHVTYDELINGYQRQADYTRNTQALAERNREVQQHREQLQQTQQKYTENLQAIEDVLKSYDQPQQYWDNLYREDPDKYAQELHQEQQRQRNLQAIKAERERVSQEGQQAQQYQAQQTLEEQRQQLKVLVPEWVDETRQSEDMKRLAGYGESVGFSRDELSGITDARAVKVLNDAARWQELQAKRKGAKPKGEAGKSEKRQQAKPGQQGKKISTGRPRNQSTNRRGLDKATQQLQKTGSMKATEQWFLQSGLAD